MAPTTTTPLRPELEPLPVRMQKLPVDSRGYAIPWFVEILPSGEPEFRAVDGRKFTAAISEHRCWVCGDVLGHHRVFVLGPMCGINRTTSEPPSHAECAIWSARNCPFLSRPHARRREDEELLANATIAGIPLMRNPGVALLWWTKTYEIFRPPIGGGVLIRIGEPDRVEWYAEGRAATRAEVVASIESGLPALRAAADKEATPWNRREAHADITRRYAAFESLFPPA